MTLTFFVKLFFEVIFSLVIEYNRGIAEKFLFPVAEKIGLDIIFNCKGIKIKVVMPFVNKLKPLIKHLTIQCVRLKEEVLQLRKEKKRLSDDVEFYKGKIKDMSDMTELFQEKVDDLERVKKYVGAEQIDTIVRKVKEQEGTEQ